MEEKVSVQTEEIQTETVKEPVVYHVIYREQDRKWQVKSENATKALKLFWTQAEAAEYARAMAAKREGRVVVHKEDGSCPVYAKGDDTADMVYHISYRKEDRKWQVKAEGANKALKLFWTQAEAIDYAKSVAGNNEGRIVIHKGDGSFRKLTY